MTPFLPPLTRRIHSAYRRPFFVNKGLSGTEQANLLALSKRRFSQLWLSGNALTAHGAKLLSKSHEFEFIDLSNMPIGDEGLRAIAQNPNLKELIVNNCGITDAGLQALANHPSLEVLVAEQNRFGPKGLTALETTKIKVLVVNSNPVADKGAEIIARLPLLWGLWANDCGITDVGAALLAKSQSPVFEKLYLNKNAIKDAGVVALVQHARIREFALCANQITAKGALALAQRQFKGIYIVDLSDNPIGREGIQAFVDGNSLCFPILRRCLAGDEAAHILANSRLAGLDLSDTGMTPKGAATLSRMTDGLVYSFILANNQLGDEGVKLLARNPYIWKLDISNNQLSSKSAVYLRQLPNLHTLNIGYNHLGSKGARTLAPMSKQLIWFSLACCHIGNEGAQAFAEAEGIPWWFDLSYNQIGLEGVQYLARLRSGSAIGPEWNLFMEGNPLGSDGAAAFLAMQKENVMLYLNGCKIGKSGIQALSQTQVTGIALDGNQLSDTDVGRLAQNDQLTILSLRNNRITDQGVNTFLPKKVA